MFNEQRYGVIIDGRKDWRFTVLVARIHISAKLQQLFFHIGEEDVHRFFSVKRAAKSELPVDIAMLDSYHREYEG